MRATINGVAVDGTPEEIAKFRSLSSKKPASPAKPDHMCDDTGIGCRICAGDAKPPEPVTDDTYI